MIENFENLMVIDVREESEYCEDDPGPSDPPAGHIPGALNYTWTSQYLQSHYDELPLNAHIIVVCKGGFRSASAADFLCTHGYSLVYNMLEGMLGWEGQTVPCCYSDGDCDDGLFCTEGAVCENLNCVQGPDPCAAPYAWCDEEMDQCVECTEDYECDGVIDAGDNCVQAANGPALGTCAQEMSGVARGTGVMCTGDSDCAAGETCQMDQQDCNSNGVGDACECYADITGTGGKVDLSDLVLMKNEFMFPCPPSSCQADCNGDGKVDLNDLVLMKAQFLMSLCPVMP